MRKLIPNLLFIFLLFLGVKTSAQSDFSHEAGVMFGVTSFQTDFGESDDFPSANAATMGFGLVYYLNFFGNEYNWRTGTSYFSEHFKLKAEFMYTSKTNIRHEPWVGLDEQGDFYAKLDAMRGNIDLYNIGTQMEFYFFTLEDYSAFFQQSGKINPYISAGVHFSMYDPKVTSTLNPNNGGGLVEIGTVEEDIEPYRYLLGNPDSPDKEDWKWTREAVYNDAGSSFGVSLGGGVRYSLNYVDMVLVARWQHFFSDKVDGLAADHDPGNKYNDTMIFVNLGVVYKFKPRY